MSGRSIVVHAAAAPIGKVQRCLRCGIVLLDRTTAQLVAGQKRVWYWTGNVAQLSATGMMTTMDAPTCEAPAKERS